MKKVKTLLILFKHFSFSSFIPGFYSGLMDPRIHSAGAAAAAAAAAAAGRPPGGVPPSAAAAHHHMAAAAAAAWPRHPGKNCDHNQTMSWIWR